MLQITKYKEDTNCLQGRQLGVMHTDAIGKSSGCSAQSCRNILKVGKEFTFSSLFYAPFLYLHA